MQVSPKVKDIVSKVFDGHSLKRNEIVRLLSINHKSLDAGFIMTAVNVINRMVSNGKSEVHAQIGLNLSPCPNDCSFCAFAAKNGVFNESKELSIEDSILLALKAEADGANAIFFMTTHNYSKAYCTVLVTKDRVLGHNPAATLYTSCSYYARMLRKGF